MNGRAALTLRDFGASIGLSDLSMGERGNVVLQTESGRQLIFEQGKDAMLLCLAQPVDGSAGDWMLRAWKRSHYRHVRQGEWPVQAALRDTGGGFRLLAVIRIPESEFTLPHLNRALEYLAQWLDQLGNDGH